MTDSQRRLMGRLIDAVEHLSQKVEEMGCTCPNDNDVINRVHAPTRRRKDSPCSGVKYGIAYRGLVRRAERALRQRQKEQR